MKTIKQLKLQKINIMKEQETPGYSWPRHQLKEIDDQIKKQQIINCGRQCPICKASGCHYGIEAGNYVYFCPACDRLIN